MQTRIRILGSGSIKKLIKMKMQLIPVPDVVWIRESYQTEWECIWIRILESGFRNFYADARFASGPYHTVWTPSSGSDWAITSLVCKGYSTSKASVRTRECYALKPDHTIQFRSRNPKLTDTMFYHLTVNPPELTRNGRLFISAQSVSLGLFLRMTRCRVGIFNADKPEFPDV
jgi:hypothetical protein